MKVFLPADFYWMPTVSHSDLIGLGMVVVFCYLLEKIISSKLLSMNENIECFFVETNLRSKEKWLLSCSRNPMKMQISNHLAKLNKSNDLYLTIYDQLLFLADFNAGVEDSFFKIFVLVITLQVRLTGLHVLT